MSATTEQLAREAGMCVELFNMGAASLVYSEGVAALCRDELERFEALARADERERAAKICDDFEVRSDSPHATLLHVADAIRSSGAEG